MCCTAERLGLTLLVAFALAWAPGDAAWGQSRARRQRAGADPPSPRALMDQMFDQIFGPVDAEAHLASIEVSAAEERRFGEAAARTYLDSLRRNRIDVVRRGKDVEYLKKLVASLRPLMSQSRRYRDIDVYVADSDAVDARCFPGGVIVVNRGLLDFAGSEAAVVGALGHELSHLDRGHTLRHIRRMKHAQQTFSPGAFRPEDFFANGLVLMKGFMQPWRPEDEAEADRDGMRWAYQLGYDPRAFAELFLRLYKVDGEQKQIPLLETHPFRMDRYRACMRQFDEMAAGDRGRKLQLGAENLNRRIPISVEQFDGD